MYQDRKPVSRALVDMLGSYRGAILGARGMGMFT